MIDGYSNIGPNLSPLRYIRLGDLDFDLLKSLKVKCNGAVGLHIRVPIDV